MTILEEIRTLNGDEALAAMEALWQRLMELGVEPDSPDWHRHELDRRDQMVANGEMGFSDWEEAKIRIRASVQ